MRYRHVMVVNQMGEIVSRKPIRLQNNEIFLRFIFYLNFAADDVRKLGHAVFRHFKTDGVRVFISRTLFN